MSAAHALVLALLWAGVACVLVSALALHRLGGTFPRLHALAPASCLGVPLIAVAVAVDQGAGRAAVKTLVIGLLFAAGGTAGTVAIGKAATQAAEQGGAEPGEPGGTQAGGSGGSGSSGGARPGGSGAAGGSGGARADGSPSGGGKER